MQNLLVILLSVFVGIIGVYVANWLAIIVQIPLIPFYRKKAKSGLLEQYIMRGVCGFVTGTLFVFLNSHGLHNGSLTIAFLILAWISRENDPASATGQVLFADCLNGNLKKFKFHMWGLLFVNILFYFFAKIGHAFIL